MTVTLDEDATELLLDFARQYPDWPVDQIVKVAIVVMAQQVGDIEDWI